MQVALEPEVQIIEEATPTRAPRRDTHDGIQRVMQRVVTMRVDEDTGRELFRVKWKGLNHSHNEWIDRADFQGDHEHELLVGFESEMAANEGRPLWLHPDNLRASMV